MNLGKKIIALSLVAVMSLQTVNATVLDRALSNYTPPQSATITDSEGNTVKSMFYTGSFYYRFTESATPPLMWTFSPPEVEVGCNGFNLKGMFMSLLGIDQFGSMLQNAGTSLAWGVAIGLIYSLPGVASVFKFINQWAKDIQKLLGNACQSGIAIGQAIAAQGLGEDVRNFEKDVDNTLTGWTLAGSKQEGIKGVGDKLGLPGLDLKWENGLKFGGTPTVPVSVAQNAFAQSIAKIFRSHSVGASIILKQIERKNQIMSKIETAINTKRLKDNPIILTKFPIIYDGVAPTSSGVDPLFTNIDIDFLSKSAGTTDDQNILGLRVLAYAFLYNYVGDIGYANQDLISKIDFLNDALKCVKIVPGATAADCQAGEEAYGKKLREYIEEGSGGEIAPMAVGRQMNISPDSYYMAIVEGFETLDKTNNKLYAPMMYMLALRGDDDANEYSYLLFPTNIDTVQNFFPSNEPFPGLRDISKCSLYNLLEAQGVSNSYISSLKQKKNVITGTLEKLNCDAMVDTPQIDLDGKPIKIAKYPVLLYGDMMRISSLISKLLPEEAMHLIGVTAETNTYKLVSAMLGQLSSVLGNVEVDSNKKTLASGNSSSETSNPIKPIQQTLLEEQRKKWALLNETFKKKMIEEFGQPDPGELIRLIHFYEQAVRERSLKNSSAN